MNKLLQSSVNPDKLSLTVKGVLVGLIPLVLIIAAALGWDILQAELNEIVDAAVNVVYAVSTAFASVMVLYGLVRKLWVKTKT